MSEKRIAHSLRLKKVKGTYLRRKKNALMLPEVWLDPLCLYEILLISLDPCAHSSIHT